MDLPRIVRTLIGLSAVGIVGVLLYYLWRIYSYFYLHREVEDHPVKAKPDPVEKRYKAPSFFYDPQNHEFYVQSEINAAGSSS